MAHAIPSETKVERRDGPSLFEGISLEVAAMQDCGEQISSDLKRLVRSCNQQQKIPAKLCAESIAKTARQLSILAEHLGSVIARNVGQSVRSRA